MLGGDGRILLDDGLERSLNEQARRKPPLFESSMSFSFVAAHPRTTAWIKITHQRQGTWIERMNKKKNLAKWNTVRTKLTKRTNGQTHQTPSNMQSAIQPELVLNSFALITLFDQNENTVGRFHCDYISMNPCGWKWKRKWLIGELVQTGIVTVLLDVLCRWLLRRGK